MASERVARLMAGAVPDRLPWLPELNEGFVRRSLGRPADGPGAEEDDYLALEAACAAAIGADHLHRVVAVRTRRRRVRVETRPDGVAVVQTPAGELRRRQEYDPNSGTVFTREHLVKGPESFPAYLAMLDDEVYEADYDRAADAVATSGLATIDAPATPLMHLLLWDMGVEPTLMTLMDAPDAMAAFMAEVHDRNKTYYDVAAAGPGRIVRCMEDTSAKLTGPAMYAEHCLGPLNDYARIVHDHGKLFIPHMCGHLGGVTGLLTEIDLDGIEAITPPPLGDADLPAMRRRLGDIWLIGGVDPSLYATAPGPEAMAAHVAGTLDAMRGDRKFMLGHEEIPVAAKPANVRAVARAIEATAEGFYD